MKIELHRLPQAMLAACTVVCLLLGSLHARADVVIVEKVQSIGENRNMTIKIKGYKFRLDEPVETTPISFIVGDMTKILLDHKEKKFMKMSEDKAKALVDSRFNADPAAAPKFVDTGKQEKVGEYNTEVYTAEMPGGKYTVWVTKDIPNYASIREQMDKMRSWLEAAVMGSNFLKASKETSKIDGMPVKTEIVRNDATTTLMLVSAKEEPVDDSDFQIPADYTEQEAPPEQKPGGAATPPKP